MARRHRAERRSVVPDPIYKDEDLTRFINRLMQRGKKTVAQGILYNAFTLVEKEAKRDPFEIYQQAVKNVSPMVEVKPRRVGGATYQVPIEVRGSRQGALAHRWIIRAARDRSGRSMSEKLAQELMDAARGQGSAVKRREDLHRMAEANRAFVHYKW